MFVYETYRPFIHIGNLVILLMWQPIMYVQMGEETDSAYQVVFRSYTGAFVNFYVDKTSGTTRMEEYVPTLDVRNEAGTIILFDYLEKK